MNSFGFNDDRPNILIKLKRKKITNSILNKINLIDQKFSFNKIKIKLSQNNKCRYQISYNYYYIPRKTSIREKFDIITQNQNNKSAKIFNYPDRNNSIKHCQLKRSSLNNNKVTSKIIIFNKRQI